MMTVTKQKNLFNRIITVLKWTLLAILLVLFIGFSAAFVDFFIYFLNSPGWRSIKARHGYTSVVVSRVYG